MIARRDGRDAGDVAFVDRRWRRQRRMRRKAKEFGGGLLLPIGGSFVYNVLLEDC